MIPCCSSADPAHERELEIDAVKQADDTTHLTASAHAANNSRHTKLVYNTATDTRNSSLIFCSNNTIRAREEASRAHVVLMHTAHVQS